MQQADEVGEVDQQLEPPKLTLPGFKHGVAEGSVAERRAAEDFCCCPDVEGNGGRGGEEGLASQSEGAKLGWGDVTDFGAVEGL